MNEELKKLIELLNYRNSVGEPLSHIVMTREMFVSLVLSTSMLIDGSSRQTLKGSG